MNLQQENFALRRELLRSQQAYLIQQRQLNDLQMEKLQQLTKELVEEEKTYAENEAQQSDVEAVE